MTKTLMMIKWIHYDWSKAFNLILLMVLGESIKCSSRKKKEKKNYKKQLEEIGNLEKYIKENFQQLTAEDFDL